MGIIIFALIIFAILLSGGIVYNGLEYSFLFVVGMLQVFALLYLLRASRIYLVL